MILGEFYNGIGISENEKNKFHSLVNVDIHSNPGKVQCSKAMEDIDSTDIIATKPSCSIVSSQGDTFFGSGTKILKVSGGVLSQVHTSISGDVLGLGEHKGYIYYATATTLSRIAVSNASSESTWVTQVDGWATFSNQYAYKPMIWVNQILCIGDGNYVAVVDENGTFVANALDILEKDIITALHNMNDYLAIGTFVNSSVHQASLYNWDTFSPSWSEDYKVFERGVNMLFDVDGYTFAQIGSVGNIYQWTGERALKFLPLKDGDNAIATDINPYGHTKLNGLTLISTKRGIYSIGKSSSIMPLALAIEYTSVLGQGTDLGAIEAIGSDILVGYATGLDHLSNDYAVGKIITPEFDGKLNKIKVKYVSMPTGCSISAKIKPDNSSFSSITMIKDDSDSREYFSDTTVNNKSTLQAEITLNPSTTSTPIVKSIIL